MRIVWYILIPLLLTVNTAYTQSAIKATKESKIALAIHGGAGTLTKKSITPEKEKAYKASLQTALTIGYNILIRGGSATDAVEAVIITLENDSLFNAGKGSVFTREGINELDASIMDGKTLDAGGVAGVRVVKNPITAARRVMDKTSHVLLAGRGAEQFATEEKLSIVSPSYFYTDYAWKSYLGAHKEDSLKQLKEKKSAIPDNKHYDMKYGTVGAVALDMNGNLAAGTSTGGMTYKMPGRIGDSPIIGAGTYADNTTCAVSCTGMGEYFIRLSVAKSVSERMALKDMSLNDAVNDMIQKKLTELGGEGGLIAVDKEGNISMSFNTPGMMRAYIKTNGETDVKLFKD